MSLIDWLKPIFPGDWTVKIYKANEANLIDQDCLRSQFRDPCAWYINLKTYICIVQVLLVTLNVVYIFTNYHWSWCLCRKRKKEKKKKKKHKHKKEERKEDESNTRSGLHVDFLENIQADFLLIYLSYEFGFNIIFLKIYIYITG